MAWGTLVLMKLYREFHQIVTMGTASFGYVTLLQVRAREHILMT